jgi:hypothetical protein
MLQGRAAKYATYITILITEIPAGLCAKHGPSKELVLAEVVSFFNICFRTVPSMRLRYVHTLLLKIKLSLVNEDICRLVRGLRHSYYLRPLISLDIVNCLASDLLAY